MAIMTSKPHPPSASHRLFLLTILTKGALGLIQLATAAALWLGVGGQLPQLAQWLVVQELSEDPTDFFASHLMAWVKIIPTTDLSFYTIYFAAHGALHVSVVAALLSGAFWANHAAIVVLAGYVIYQMLEWWNVGGAMLIVLTAIDLFVIYLTLRENRR